MLKESEVYTLKKTWLSSLKVLSTFLSIAGRKMESNISFPVDKSSPVLSYKLSYTLFIATSNTPKDQNNNDMCAVSEKSGISFKVKYCISTVAIPIP